MSTDLVAMQLDRRRFIQAGLGVCLLGGGALATSGCGNSKTGGSGGSGAEKSVDFFSWEIQTVMQPVLDLFTKQTGLTVTFSNAPPVKEYVTTLDAKLKSGTAADVFSLTAENRHMVPDGYVKDLSDQPFLDVMNSANREFMTFDGKVYGLSISSWAGGIMYNKALLAKAGTASLPDSWEGFLGLCGKLKSLGVVPYYDAAADGNFMSLWGLLGGYFADQGHFPDLDIFAGKTTFAETWTEPLTAYCELYTRGLIPKSAATLAVDPMVSEFTKGRVAMIGAGPWNVSAVQKGAPNLSFETGAIPGINKGTTYWTGAASPGYAINTKAKHPEASLKFLQFMASEEGVKAFGLSGGAITTTSNYTPTMPVGLRQQAVGARSGRIYLPVVRWPRHSDDLATFLTTQILEVIRGSLKPQQIAAALDNKLKQLDTK